VRIGRNFGGAHVRCGLLWMQSSLIFRREPLAVHR
jgi:hypothetical protein